MAKNILKSEATASRPRDEKGHFINIPQIKSTDNVLTRFLMSHTGNYKDQEDLLDIRIGNPLGRIINLLEEIKNQKAFSFTLKGSLGIAGVVLVISLFGIFGGGQIICEKGRQTEVGTIKVLQAKEIYSNSVPVLSYFLELVSPPQKTIKNRVVLIKNDSSTINIPYVENIDLSKYSDAYVAATGTYNSCSQALSIMDTSDIEAR